MVPPLKNPLEKLETDSNGRFFFRDYYVFGTDSKLKILSFIIRSTVVSIKCRFNQIWFRSNVVRPSVIRSIVGSRVNIITL